MRNFKKISAIVLVIAMLFSLVTVNVFAADNEFTFTYKITAGGSDITTVGAKGGTNINVEIYMPAGDYAMISSGLKCIGHVDSTKVGRGINFDKLTVSNKYSSDTSIKDYLFFKANPEEGVITVKADEPILTIPMTVPTDAEAEKDVELLSAPDGATAYSATNTKLTFVPAAATLKVKEGFDVESAVAVKGGAEVTQTAPIAVGMGTSLTKAVEGVTATLKNSDGTKTDVGYKIDWDANTDYNPNTTTVQEVTGKVTVDGKKTANATTEPVPVKAYIQVGKIDIATDTDVVIDKVKNVTFQATKEAGTVTEAKILDEAGKITSVAVKKGTNYNGTLTLSGWAVSGETKTLESKTVSTVDKATGVPSTNFVTLTANATAADSDKIFTGVKAVTFYAYITPAEIEGGSFELTDSTFVPNTKPSVKVTIPATVFDSLPEVYNSENTEQYTITVSIPNKTAGEPAETKSVVMSEKQVSDMKTAIAAAKADGKDVSTVAPFTTIVDLDKTLSDLGYDTTDANKAFTVSVTVGGTTLLAGKNEDGTVIKTVGGTVVKPSSGGPSGNIGINKGNTTKTYAVTVVETKNGTATVSADKAAQGTTVTVKAEPAEGYKVKTVTVTKADGTNVPVDEKALTFTMPASAVKVAVEFEEGKDEPSVDPTPAEDKFADVADDFWAAKYIYTLKDAGIIGGKSATEFDPEGDVTRAEFAKMVVGLFGYKATSSAVNFTDCGADDWFTEFVAAGVEAGVIKGVNDTEFAPNATITREDACTILGRALNKVAQSAELKFTDADKVAEYAAPYVALLSELGYLNGYEDGSFAPANNITRAEAAKIIAGIYNANKSAETVTDDKTETDANADAAVDEKVEEKVEEKTDEKAVDTTETEPEK